jgi:hypothetical protein
MPGNLLWSTHNERPLKGDTGYQRLITIIGGGITVQNKIQKLAAIAAVLAVPGLAFATPVYTTFGSLPGANFGGTGIPNSAVAKTEVFVNGTDQITLALTAHARFSNPTVTDNGAGEYFAGPGQNCGIGTDPVGCPSGSQGALWNFAYYIEVAGGGVLSDYTFTLNYDFDPGVNTPFGQLGTVNVSNYMAAVGYPGYPATATLIQDSQNLLFSGFSTPVAGVVTVPTIGSFNPNAIGEYNFYLSFQKTNLPIFTGTVGIDMNVVPVPAAVWLFGSALGLVGVMRRRVVA